MRAGRGAGRSSAQTSAPPHEARSRRAARTRHAADAPRASSRSVTLAAPKGFRRPRAREGATLVCSTCSRTTACKATCRPPGFRSPARERPVAHHEALGDRLLRRPRHASRRGAHLLRADVAVPDAAACRLAARNPRRVPGDVQLDRQPSAWRRAGGHARAAQRGCARRAEKQRHGRRRAAARDRDGDVRDDRLPRGDATSAEPSCSKPHRGAASCDAS